MEESDDGEWIKYSDYLKEKEEWNNEVEITYDNDELYKRIGENPITAEELKFIFPGGKEVIFTGTFTEEDDKLKFLFDELDIK